MATIAGLLFAGGKAQGSSSGAKPGTTKRIGAKGSLPLSDGSVTFTVFAGNAGTAAVTSHAYADNAFTRKVVDETKVKLDFISTTGADANERLNVMLSTGTYPDIILYTIGNRNDWMYYANQGIFVDLNKYGVMDFPNIKKVFDQWPLLNDFVRGSNGSVYALPDINECIHCIYQYGRSWYYMPWVRDRQATGGKVPSTLDELTDYLRYVKNTDLNKNGKKDEVPIAFGAGHVNNFIAFFAKAFMPFVASGDWGLALTNKQIVEQYRQNEFRDTLRYLNGIYKEGLIAENSFSMIDQEIRSLVNSPDPMVGFMPINWAPLTQPSQRWIEYFNIPPVKGPNGSQWAPNGDPYSIFGARFFVTDKCKDPELAIALYDYLLSGYEMNLNGILGTKGVVWDTPLANAPSIGGGKTYWRLLLPNSNDRPLNVSWEQETMPSNRSSEWFYAGNQGIGADDAKKWLQSGDPSLRDKLLANTDYGEEMWVLSSQKYKPYDMPSSYFIPPIAYSEADNNRMADINAALIPYIQKACVEFITGARNIETGWNTYLADLERLGSAEKARIIQKYIK
jgi:putative aldouronate transport system substrate-binding protein